VKFRGKTGLLLIGLAASHLAIIFAGFLSPYDPAKQNRMFPYAPPSSVHFIDGEGNVHVRPFVCALKYSSGAMNEYSEDRSNCSSVRWLVSGSQYHLFGLVNSNLHLFGVDAETKVFLMGTDAYGRDVFSRFLYAGQISLFAGLLATVLSLGLGTLLGTLAGYYAGWLDVLVMRGAELFLALPWLYLLFAVRAFLPLTLSTGQAFLLLVAVIGLVGWVRPAKMIRNLVLSARERHYVLAARLFGGSDVYLMRRHVLPNVYSVVLTQAALLVPQFVLAEVVLSFLGLGVGEPTPSWGNMLTTLQQYAVLVSYWWMLIPGLMLVPVFLGYLLLANALQQGRVAG
jgi:peptide/nickel transport system permease protein